MNRPGFPESNRLNRRETGWNRHVGRKCRRQLTDTLRACGCELVGRSKNPTATATDTQSRRRRAEALHGTSLIIHRENTMSQTKFTFRVEEDLKENLLLLQNLWIAPALS